MRKFRQRRHVLSIGSIGFDSRNHAQYRNPKRGFDVIAPLDGAIGTLEQECASCPNHETEKKRERDKSRPACRGDKSITREVNDLDLSQLGRLGNSSLLVRRA